MSYANRHILVLGMGRSGAAALALLLRKGARVSAYDRDPGALAELPPAVIRIESAELPAFADYDAVIASPGFALSSAPELIPEVDLAAEFLDVPIVGVTGTNGKSTVTVMIGEMLRESGFETGVGGNLGTPLCEFIDRPELERLVAELSSFQLEHARKLHVRVAVLTNLAPDHLDRHGSYEAYGAAKARLAELQSPNDTVVANLDDPWAERVARSANAQLFGFSERRALDHGAFVDASALVVVRDGEVRLRVALASLSSAARAPLANALAASAAAVAMDAEPEAMSAVLTSFQGLPHRVSEVCTRNGVRYVDDSKATNPAAAAASLAAQEAPVVWIAGGRNKGLEFSPLVPAAGRARAVVVYGESAPELARAFASATDVVSSCKLESAVREAAARALPGDVVLLAPACASHDQFGSYEERGERFAELARALPESGAAGAETC